MFSIFIEGFPIPSHVWEYPKYRVIPQTLGLPEISCNTWYFGLPATWWFSKLNRIRSGIKKILGSRSSLGARWALAADHLGETLSWKIFLVSWSRTRPTLRLRPRPIPPVQEVSHVQPWWGASKFPANCSSGVEVDHLLDVATTESTCHAHAHHHNHPAQPTRSMTRWEVKASKR